MEGAKGNRSERQKRRRVQDLNLRGRNHMISSLSQEIVRVIPINHSGNSTEDLIRAVTKIFLILLYATVQVLSRLKAENGRISDKLCPALWFLEAVEQLFSLFLIA